MSSIISATVMNVLAGGKRTKPDMAIHTLGSYDFKNKIAQNTIYPVDVLNLLNYPKLSKNMGAKLESIIKKISSIKLDKYVKSELTTSISKEDEFNIEGFSLPKLNIPNLDLFSTKEGPYYIDEKNQKEIKDKVKQYIGIELIEDFFNLGSLKKKNEPFPNKSVEYFGTEKEKRK